MFGTFVSLFGRRNARFARLARAHSAFFPAVERLEERVLPTFMWTAGFDNNWSNPKNWIDDTQPGGKATAYPGAFTTTDDVILRTTTRTCRMDAGVKSTITLHSLDVESTELELGRWQEVIVKDGTCVIKRDITFESGFLGDGLLAASRTPLLT